MQIRYLKGCERRVEINYIFVKCGTTIWLDPNGQAQQIFCTGCVQQWEILANKLTEIILEEELENIEEEELNQPVKLPDWWEKKIKKEDDTS